MFESAKAGSVCVVKIVDNYEEVRWRNSRLKVCEAFRTLPKGSRYGAWCWNCIGSAQRWMMWAVIVVCETELEAEVWKEWQGVLQRKLEVTGKFTQEEPRVAGRHEEERRRKEWAERFEREIKDQQEWIEKDRSDDNVVRLGFAAEAYGVAESERPREWNGRGVGSVRVR